MNFPKRVFFQNSSFYIIDSLPCIQNTDISLTLQINSSNSISLQSLALSKSSNAVAVIIKNLMLQNNFKNETILEDEDFKLTVTPTRIIESNSFLDVFQPHMPSLLLLALFYLQHEDAQFVSDAFSFLCSMSPFFLPADFRPTTPIVSQLSRFKSAIYSDDMHLRKICAKEVLFFFYCYRIRSQRA